jgi:alanine dehydrogenase
MNPIELTYLSGADIDALALSDDEILAAVRDCLAQQGRGDTVVEPRVHLFPPDAANGHFNVLRGALPGLAGVKVVGDYVDNHTVGLPSELALLLLLDPGTGAPLAILDATAITAMRTGAMTALGGQYLARRSSRALGHIGARGTAYWNVRLLCRVLPELHEIRIHSRRAESREQLAERLTRDLPGRDIHAVAGWEDCVVGADVVVEATRLTTPQPLLRTEWIAPRRRGGPPTRRTLAFSVAPSDIKRQSSAMRRASAALSREPWRVGSTARNQERRSSAIHRAAGRVARTLARRFHPNARNQNAKARTSAWRFLR